MVRKMKGNFFVLYQSLQRFEIGRDSGNDDNLNIFPDEETDKETFYESETESESE